MGTPRRKTPGRHGDTTGEGHENGTTELDSTYHEHSLTYHLHHHSLNRTREIGNLPHRGIINNEKGEIWKELIIPSLRVGMVRLRSVRSLKESIRSSSSRVKVMGNISVSIFFPRSVP
jgi:hypothetical protein